jgi:omega-hydroxy-beta-dihydromenaquinone-9 sulfotransferase
MIFPPAKPSTRMADMKRRFLLGLMLTGLALAEVFNQAGLILDYILFPGFKKLTLKPPVFITGMPRSATTLCFDILNYDSRQFSSMKLWEILFAPSIIQKKLAILIWQIDRKLNQPLFSILSKFDKYLFKSIESIHPISLFNFEEDDYLFIHKLYTLSFAFAFPKSTRFIPLATFDTAVPVNRKKSLMKFYKKCIQSHMYVYGKDKIYLAKSPSHTSKIKTLDNTFPESRFIYMLRDPCDAISSTISLFSLFGKIFASGIDLPEITRRTLALADHWYSYPITISRNWPANRFEVVLFNNLTSDPALTIKKLYAGIGLIIPVDFEILLGQKEEEIKAHKNKHVYSPNDYGIKRKDTLLRYQYVYANYPGVSISQSPEFISPEPVINLI